MYNARLTHLNFYSLMVIASASHIQSASVTYSIISRDGYAHIYDSNHKEVAAAAPQWFLYDLLIDSNKSITFAHPKKEYAGVLRQQTPFGHINIVKGISILGNYAEIRNIIKPLKYTCTIRLYDKGVQEPLVITVGQEKGTFEFNKRVPWDQDGNYFTIEIVD